MDREMLAEWLRDIAQHIEEESPLIRDVSVDDALSDEGLARKIITVTFNAPVAPHSLKRTPAVSLDTGSPMYITA